MKLKTQLQVSGQSIKHEVYYINYGQYWNQKNYRAYTHWLIWSVSSWQLMSLSPEFHSQIYPLLFVSSFKTPDGYAKNTHIQVFWQDVAAVAQSNHQLLTQWLCPSFIYTLCYEHILIYNDDLRKAKPLEDMEQNGNIKSEKNNSTWKPSTLQLIKHCLSVVKPLVTFCRG